MNKTLARNSVVVWLFSAEKKTLITDGFAFVLSRLQCAVVPAVVYFKFRGEFKVKRGETIGLNVHAVKNICFAEIIGH